MTVSNGDGIQTTNENPEAVQILKRCFNEKIDSETLNILGTVKKEIQNAVKTAIDIIITPRVELAIRSKNASSGRYAASVTGKSEHGERLKITASFKNVSERNKTVHELNTNDETHANIRNKAGESSVPRTYFDRQSHTHHSWHCIFH